MLKKKINLSWNLEISSELFLQNQLSGILVTY